MEGKLFEEFIKPSVKRTKSDGLNRNSKYFFIVKSEERPTSIP